MGVSGTSPSAGAQNGEHGAKIGKSVLCGLPDVTDRIAGACRVLINERLGGGCLDGDDRQAVGDGVVNFTSDVDAFFADPPERLLFSRTFGLTRALFYFGDVGSATALGLTEEC